MPAAESLLSLTQKLQYGASSLAIKTCGPSLLPGNYDELPCTTQSLEVPYVSRMILKVLWHCMIEVSFVEHLSLVCPLTLAS